MRVYFDQGLLTQETAKLFKQGPRYAGHTLMVPNEGDYATLPWENDGRVLVRNAQGLELISNVCRHRQAKMLSGRGNANVGHAAAVPGAILPHGRGSARSRRRPPGSTSISTASRRG